MPQKFYEGQEFHNPSDPSAPVLVYRGGKFYPKQEQPGGNVADAEAPVAALTPGSDARGRLALGLGPVVNAQRNMFSAEGGGDPNKRVNPFNEHPVRSFLSSLDNGKIAEWAGFSLDPLARGWGIGKNDKGRQEFQDYDQAAKSFEAAMMPIMSGAAVTPSEAQRQIRANLPAWGDTPLTLERKATNRAMMANGAAELLGKPRPFPRVGVWDFRGEKSGSQPRAGQPAAPGTGGSAPPPQQRERGKTYQTPKGPMRWTGTGWVPA